MSVFFNAKTVILALILVILNCLYASSNLLDSGPIKCYKCTRHRPPLHSKETVRLCADFDYSERYIVDCPFSTFCTKRFVTGNILGSINSTERDCASQTYKTQIYKNGSWRQDVSVQEPYKEGCATIENKLFRSALILDCYCKGDLCNSAKTPSIIAIIYPLFTILSMKL